MKLELFTLCDYARGEPTGKLYVIGTFDHIFANQEPVPAPPCAIAARLRFDGVEQGVRSVSVAFVDSDGAKVIPDVSVQMKVELPPSETTVTANVVLMLPQLSLPRFGEYSIDLAVDSRLEGSIPLYVRSAPQQNPAPRLPLQR